MRLRKCLLGALLLIPLEVVAAPRPVDGKAAFQKMKSLVGRWEAKTKSGKRIQVSYKTIANGSVLAETWGSPGGRVSMTMFHMDGEALLLTHYCPQGNQPRLRFTPSASKRALIAFRFLDATNLADKSDSHMHEVDFRFKDADTLVRTETYLSKGKPDVGTLTFVRTRPQGALWDNAAPHEQSRAFEDQDLQKFAETLSEKPCLKEAAWLPSVGAKVGFAKPIKRTSDRKVRPQLLRSALMKTLLENKRVRLMEDVRGADFIVHLTMSSVADSKEGTEVRTYDATVRVVAKSGELLCIDDAKIKKVFRQAAVQW